MPTWRVSSNLYVMFQPMLTCYRSGGGSLPIWTPSQLEHSSTASKSANNAGDAGFGGRSSKSDVWLKRRANRNGASLRWATFWDDKNRRRGVWVVSIQRGLWLCCCCCCWYTRLCRVPTMLRKRRRGCRAWGKVGLQELRGTQYRG